ncbi:MAG: DUF4440 domain-containing protein [Pseudonocardiaceae bacterium]|nr:DUF4440 domain-containing protein [Pseudonocardiaceae bacterium]
MPRSTAAAPADLARALYRALADGDRETLDGLLHPEFEGRIADGMPLGTGGDYDGPDAMRRDFWKVIGQHFEARAEPAEIHEVDDGRLLVTGHYTGRARGSGTSLRASFAHLLTVADNRIRRLVQFTDTRRWSDALADGAAATEPSGRRELSVVAYDVSDGVATVRLNRPDAGNALDRAMAEDLAEVATRCAEDERVRAVLLCASGATFSYGGDVALFAATPHGELGAALRRMIDSYHLALQRFTDLDAPVVAAVRGAAAGGALGLVHCADVVVAAQDSKFALGYGTLGLSSDGGNTWFLPRLVGLRRAQQLLLQQRTLSAPEALEWGLVTEVVPAEDVEPDAIAIARQLATGPTRAFGAVRRLLRDSMSTPLDEQLAAEQRSIVEAAATSDAAEGIASFAAKRHPRFRGQ